MMKPFIVKYDYEDMYGFGAKIVFAESPEDAVIKFQKHMINSKDSNFYGRTVYHNNEFRHICMNVFSWHTFINNKANICLKVREIDDRFGDVIPIQEYFEQIESDLRR